MKGAQNSSPLMGILQVVLKKTLFVKKEEGKLMISHIYVDNIVFGGISNKMVEHFGQQM